MKDDVEFSREELISYYENEADEVPIFGSVREIGLVENIMHVLPKSFKTIIDVGCGEGYLLYCLEKKYPQSSLFGLDLTNGRIQATKKHVPKAKLLRGDIFELPFPDNTFDVVICSELLEHLTDYPKAISELIRITKKRLIVTVPNELPLIKVMCPRCKTKHYLDEHVNFFTEEKIRYPFAKRSDITIRGTRKFHSIYTYNRLTLKLPVFLRITLDQTVLWFNRWISFLKPNFLLIDLEKEDSKEE